MLRFYCKLLTAYRKRGVLKLSRITRSPSDRESRATTKRSPIGAY
ncbi:hypothetical protein [Planktothricoides raciborskii]|nr:hypothetical protein [Planktothricoides raciborskii]